MTAEAILALVAQGLALLPTIIQTGVDVTSRIENLIQLSSAGTAATPDQIKAVRDQLDQDLADFNTDLPPASA